MAISKIGIQGLCLMEDSTGDSFGQKAESYTNSGHFWTADDQCKLLYGSNASFCHVILLEFLKKIIL